MSSSNFSRNSSRISRHLNSAASETVAPTVTWSTTGLETGSSNYNGNSSRKYRQVNSANSETVTPKSDMVNTWTGNGAPHTTAAAPAHSVHGKWPSHTPFHNTSNMVNISTKRWAQYTAAAPDQVFQDHNRGTKGQVRGALLCIRAPPEPDKPHTKVTKQGKLLHWCPHHNLWTMHKPYECKIQPDPDRDQGGAPKGAQKENF